MRLFPEYADRIVHRAVTHQNNLVMSHVEKNKRRGYICNRCNQCKLGYVKEKKESRGADKESYPTIALNLSTLCIAFSNRSSRVRFSTSLRSNTATLSSNRARAFRSCATISFAWLNNCAVKSSSSVFACDNWFSAALRKFCSRLSAFCSCNVSSGSGPGCGGITWDWVCGGADAGGGGGVGVALGRRPYGKNDVSAVKRLCCWGSCCGCGCTGPLDAGSWVGDSDLSMSSDDREDRDVRGV